MPQEGASVTSARQTNERSAGADRFISRFALHACSHPMEQMMALLALIEGGVLERHPGLCVAFLEAGCEWLPYWLYRLDEVEYRHLAGEVEQTVCRAPSLYFRGQCFVGFEPDEPYLRELGALLQHTPGAFLGAGVDAHIRVEDQVPIDASGQEFVREGPQSHEGLDLLDRVGPLCIAERDDLNPALDEEQLLEEAHRHQQSRRAELPEETPAEGLQVCAATVCAAVVGESGARFAPGWARREPRGCALTDVPPSAVAMPSPEAMGRGSRSAVVGVPAGAGGRSSGLGLTLHCAIEQRAPRRMSERKPGEPDGGAPG